MIAAIRINARLIGKDVQRFREPPVCEGLGASHPRNSSGHR